MSDQFSRANVHDSVHAVFQAHPGRFASMVDAYDQIQNKTADPEIIEMFEHNMRSQGAVTETRLQQETTGVAGLNKVVSVRDASPPPMQKPPIQSRAPGCEKIIPDRTSFVSPKPAAPVVEVTSYTFQRPKRTRGAHNTGKFKIQTAGMS